MNLVAPAQLARTPIVAPVDFAAFVDSAVLAGRFELVAADPDLGSGPDFALDSDLGFAAAACD